MCTCPALGPRRDFNARPLAASPYGLPSLAQRRLPQLRFLRGSITQPAHSLFTLRSAGYPNTTQNSLPGGQPTLPRRDFHPKGPNERFQTIHPPFPGLSWRKPNKANSSIFLHIPLLRKDLQTAGRVRRRLPHLLPSFPDLIGESIRRLPHLVRVYPPWRDVGYTMCSKLDVRHGSLRRLFHRPAFLPDELLHPAALDIADQQITLGIESQAVNPVNLPGLFLPIGGFVNGPELLNFALGIEAHEYLILRRPGVHDPVVPSRTVATGSPSGPRSLWHNGQRSSRTRRAWSAAR